MYLVKYSKTKTKVHVKNTYTADGILKKVIIMSLILKLQKEMHFLISFVDDEQIPIMSQHGISSLYLGKTNLKLELNEFEFT